MWSGHEVPGMILLHDLKGTMRLSRSKVVSLNVSTCTSYDFNAFNASCVAVVALIRRVFLCLVTQMGDRWRIDVCSDISSELTNNFLWKKYQLRWNIVLSIWWSQQTTKLAMETTDIPPTQGSSHVGITNEDSALHILRYQGHCTLWIHFTRPYSQPSLLCEGVLKRFPETVCRKRPEIWPNDWIVHHDSAPAHKALAVFQAVSGPKIDYWTVTPTLFPWFGF